MPRPRPGLASDAPDGEATHLVVLVLTSAADEGDQLELLADVARTFATNPARAQAEALTSYTEFLALVRTLHGIDPATGGERAHGHADPAYEHGGGVGSRRARIDSPDTQRSLARNPAMLPPR